MEKDCSYCNNRPHPQCLHTKGTSFSTLYAGLSVQFLLEKFEGTNGGNQKP